MFQWKSTFFLFSIVFLSSHPFFHVAKAFLRSPIISLVPLPEENEDLEIENIDHQVLVDSSVEEPSPEILFLGKTKNTDSSFDTSQLLPEQFEANDKATETTELLIDELDDPTVDGFAVLHTENTERAMKPMQTLYSRLGPIEPSRIVVDVHNSEFVPGKWVSTSEPSFEECSCARSKSESLTDGVCQSLCKTISNGFGPRYVYDSMCLPDGCKQTNIIKSPKFPGCKKAYATKYPSGSAKTYDQLCVSLCESVIDESNTPQRWINNEIAECAQATDTTVLINCFKKYHGYQNTVSCSLD